MRVHIQHDDVEHLSKTVKNGFKNIADPVWQAAFSAYNVDPDNKFKLSMKCFSCYVKVFLYCKKQIDASNLV